MASLLNTHTPNGSDYPNSSTDWTLSSGSDLDALIDDTTLTNFISCTAAGKINTIEFVGIHPSINVESINWVKVGGYEMNLVAGSTSSFFISLLDGGNSDAVFGACNNQTIGVTSPANVMKAGEWETTIFPFSDAVTAGDDVWTATNINNLKVKIQSRVVSNTLKIPYMYIEVNINKSNPATITTYPAKNGLRVRKGKITIR